MDRRVGECYDPSRPIFWDPFRTMPASTFDDMMKGPSASDMIQELGAVMSNRENLITSLNPVRDFFPPPPPPPPLSVNLRRMICGKHFALSREITDVFSDSDFEAKWVAMGEDEQRRRIREATKYQEEMEEAANMGFAWESPKINCPELTLQSLLHDLGRGFIDLLKACTLVDSHVNIVQLRIL